MTSDDEYSSNNKYNSDELLITLVERYTNLYDKSRKDYKDETKKDLAWREIANMMQSSVEQCQHSWIRLRKRYSAERKIQKSTPVGSAVSGRTPWSLFSRMSYIDRFMSERRGGYTEKKLLPSYVNNISKMKVEQDHDPLPWESLDVIVTTPSSSPASTPVLSESDKPPEPKKVKPDFEEMLLKTLKNIEEYEKKLTAGRNGMNVLMGNLVTEAMIRWPREKQNRARVRIMELIEEIDNEQDKNSNPNIDFKIKS